MSEQDILCPKCRRFGMRTNGIFLECLWNDCLYLIRADEYKEPKVREYKAFRDSIKIKR